ncbi:MAG TPA: hypothetical protein PKC39_12850 [Ferruginibacter sp.]|nr:hypothetical protein [Ferruginibacter sp.]HMP21841.1 hypothetical protein [Ferruginibacter sp.]
MKKQQTFSFFNRLGKKELEVLTTVVAETIAPEFVHTDAKVFGSADLWSIHRSRRVFVQRRGIM